MDVAVNVYPRRAQLVALARGGDAYGFLAGAEEYLRTAAGDAEVRELAVRAYAQLGLASAARRLIQDEAVSAATRDRLAGLIPDVEQRVPWNKLDGRFRANLAVFDERTGLGDALLDVWRASRSKLQLFVCTDGNLQVFSRVPDAEGWLPGLFPHGRHNNPEPYREQWSGKLIPTLAINGLGLGFLPRTLIEASRQIYLDYSPPVILFEPALVAWAVALHLHDWWEILAEPRICICAGDEAWSRFESAVADPDHVPPTIVSDGPAWPGGRTNDELHACAKREEERREQNQRQLFERACRPVAERDAAWWARRFGDAGQGGQPLVVLGITSRYTTVLQYTMRDLLAAFERQGHQTHLSIEPDDHAHFSPAQVTQEIERLRPDLIILIDHLRREYPHVFPDNIPGVCWIQDRLPHLFTKEAGGGVRPLEFVIGHGFPECMTQYDYPGERFFPCMIPTSPEQMLDPDERPKDLEPYRCEVMYATNASSTPAELHQRHRARFKGPGQQFVDAAFEVLMSVVQEPTFCGDYDYGGLVARVERETGVEVEFPEVRGEIVGILRGTADQYLREQTVRAAARWADETGGRFHLYGRGWEQRDEFARFARGVVEHGRPLGRAFRAAKISLHGGTNPALHQRVLDGLCAGGFFLVQEKPSETAGEINRAICAYARERKLTPPFGFLPRDLPEPHGTDLARFLQVRGSDPAAEVHVDREMFLNVRAQCEWGVRPNAADIWPRYSEIAFRSPEKLVERIEHFLGHEEERRQLAGEMRAAVIERFTYDAVARSLVDLVAQTCAGRRPALAES